MSTIKVLTDTLRGGYGPIIEYYNQHKSADSTPISKLDRSEGGFQKCLNQAEITRYREWNRSPFADENDTIKQLRWCNGRLESGCYIGFNDKETELLFRALQHSLGAECVVMV